jgi:Ca2+-binding RTX toxin-like protein
VDYTLAAGQEVEWLRANAGTTGLTLTGNELRNTIEGGAGDDRLYGGRGGDKLRGGDGADVLDGGTSNDRLEGQGGADIFLFGTRFVGVTNVDTIADFQVGIDTIVLDRTYFASLALGQLSTSSFAIGSATGTNPQIVYDQFTGALFYDSNGATAGGASQFATLTGSPALTNADFKIVS